VVGNGTRRAGLTRVAGSRGDLEGEIKTCSVKESGFVFLSCARGTPVSFSTCVACCCIPSRISSVYLPSCRILVRFDSSILLAFPQKPAVESRYKNRKG
jgi:hypothetical protein